MIPWFQFHTYSIGPITLQVWGTFVAIGFLVGTWVAVKRAQQLGLNHKLIWDFAFWIFIAAMIGSRIFHALFYGLDYYIQHPWAAIDPREPGYAIMGGLLSAAGTFFFLVHKHRLNWIEYADAMIWGVPWGCGIGRIGCFLIHDHPGTASDFFLAVQYPDGVKRHDHGLYLSIVGFTIAIVFLIIARKKRPPLFYFGLFLLLDGLSRFILDFYRIIDARYFYLTPTQWVSIVFVGLGLAMLFKRETFLRK